jgi:hypothetical protein
MGSAFLDWALESFSGYVAADELDEEPYCVVSVVDNRQYKRILYSAHDVVLMAQAIFTTIARAFSDLSAGGLRNVTHGLKEACNPRRTASAKPSDFPNWPT